MFLIMKDLQEQVRAQSWEFVNSSDGSLSGSPDVAAVAGGIDSSRASASTNRGERNFDEAGPGEEEADAPTLEL